MSSQKNVIYSCITMYNNIQLVQLWRYNLECEQTPLNKYNWIYLFYDISGILLYTLHSAYTYTYTIHYTGNYSFLSKGRSSLFHWAQISFMIWTDKKGDQYLAFLFKKGISGYILCIKITILHIICWIKSTLVIWGPTSLMTTHSMCVMELISQMIK